MVSIVEWRNIPCTVFGSTVALFVSQLLSSLKTWVAGYWTLGRGGAGA